MANKKSTSKSKKNTKKKSPLSSLIAVIIILAIVAIGYFIAPNIHALEGKVYSVNLEVSRTEVTYNLGENINLTYDAYYKYIAVNKGLEDEVTITYKDSNGNVIDEINTSKKGVYTATYSLNYKGNEKEVVVTITILGKTKYIFKDGETVIETKELDEGRELTFAPKPTKDEYKFVGWKIEGSNDIITFPYTATNDVTFIAVWELKGENIKYTFKDGDEVIEVIELEDGEELVNTPIVINGDLVFAGWKIEGSSDIITIPYVSTSDVTLVATWREPDDTSTTNLEFHFIDPTSAYAYAGDAIYIKAGDVDILIDAGPRQGSAKFIEQYIDQYCTDKVLEYVIVTHADQDHIAGFVGTSTAPSIFEYYTCEVLIDFPLSDKTTQLYNNYKSKRDAAVANGMTYYTALQCYNETDGAQSEYELADGITMTILYNYYYDHKASDENNYSVCVLFSETYTDKHFLFTGDLELKGEEYLVENNDLPEVELFKAGHHGSPTSSNECLLEVIKPKVVVFTGVAGADEYTKDIDRIFPSTFAIDRLAKYTDKMYCLGALRNGNYEALNGSVVVKYKDGELTVHGTNNDTLLKDTWWFNSDVEYYNTTNSNGAVQMLLDNKHTTADGTRKWRVWKEEE